MVTAVVAPAGSMRDLTDEQVDQLLTRAATRMREKAQQNIATQNNDDLRFNFPKLDPGNVSNLLSQQASSVKQQAGSRTVDDPVTATKAKKQKKKATAGADWYDMPRTDLTPELKRDLQLIKMRNTLDPHRQYKKENGKLQAPDFSQVGTIIEGSTEFFNGRVENKQRKRTFAEEILAGEHETKRFKRQYGELQQKTTSGKKAFYKTLKEKRKGVSKKGAIG